ncbi:response regulator [Daejeonella lutea]|uniref:cAMP-binding domain of CRP or a regulatory subunit of cAMP-dependent protein kinases n=1 Tax=Daejeonella lutea TaxID=572036 RepID=A0A1T5A581_9SPHI|nr:response regulator [Daejeonella lutea]SKB30088.1 cAMP-binding domain of CRP or a regulatory subunit of cAMP-dependent protein kinases [Daejeonella lutea]
MKKSNSTVLVIEDNQDIRESTAEILELADYQVYTAENGKKGVELAQNHLPDIILCDIMMPELDGYGVLYMLNKNEKTADIPFIFITAKSERVDMRRGMEMGADDYLTKPFSDMELLNAIEARLQKRAAIVKGAGSTGSLENLLDEARSVKLLTELSENSRQRSFKKKQTIFSEGDQLSHVFMIKAGGIRTFMIYQDGREIATGMLGPGEFFGYESVILNKACTDNAETLENTELYLISRDDFNTLLFKNPGISRKFIDLLSGNVREKQEQLLKLAYNSVRKRVGDALVSLAEKFGEKDSDTVTIRVSRDDLAAMVGTANETVSRTLTDFKDEHLIEKEASNIKILSLSKLRKIKQ